MTARKLSPNQRTFHVDQPPAFSHSTRNFAIASSRPRVTVRHVGNCRYDRGDRPEPSKLRRRAEVGILVYAADHFAVGKHVIVLVLPLAKGA